MEKKNLNVREKLEKIFLECHFFAIYYNIADENDDFVFINSVGGIFTSSFIKKIISVFGTNWCISLSPDCPYLMIKKN